MTKMTRLQALKKITKALQSIVKIKQPILYNNDEFYESWNKAINELNTCKHLLEND